MKIFCLLCLLLLASCDLSLTGPSAGAIGPFEKAQVMLPSDGGIAIRWVMPPLEDDALVKSRRNRYNLKFSVAPDGTPWIGYNDKYLLIPAIPLCLEVLNGYQDLTQLENGVVFISKPTEFGFMAAAKRRKGLFSSNKKTNSASLVAVQPISQLPIPNCRMFRGENNCLYFSGLNKSTSQYDVYLLRPEQVTVDGQKIKTLKGYTQIFSNPKKINAVTGDGNTAYIAIENTILSIQSGAKVAENIFVHPSKTITQLQYNTRSGLFYSTNDKIGYVGKNGHLEFFSRKRSQISLDKTSLYVFSEEDFGVLAFDHIDALSRMNLHIKKMVPTEKRETADEKIEIVAQLGHMNSVETAAFSPDGKYVISGQAWAMVTNTEAIFTFPATNRKEWSWYNTDTPVNRMEYGWYVSIGDHKSGYQFGPMLFNSGNSKQTTGSLSRLLRRCQHDLWLVSKDGSENIGSYGNATVVDRKVQVKISDKELIKKLFKTKPTYVYMTLVTPEFTSRQKITVEYQTQE